MELRQLTLKAINRIIPIKVKGDANISDSTTTDLSCVINFYGRTDRLRTAILSLLEQDLPKDRFEILLIEDKGGTKEGKEIAQEFSNILNINYVTVEKNFGKMGYSRNLGAEKSSGKFILFLDDDTIILQTNFLSTLLKEFLRDTTCDVIVPEGKASFCLLKKQYQYHEKYFPANKCTAYRRTTLKELGGFISDITGQEDVEMYLRLIANGKTIKNTNSLTYFHPPFIVEKSNKPQAVGLSFAKLKGKYPFLIWILLLINGCRYLPLALFPINLEYKYKARFSIGFLKGIIYYLFMDKEVEYT